ncbi:D-arabinono-1,4-lactone oxidase, partial [Salmonella enterica]|uniref:D-arabinono-1,4-lactone oxidase n=1 Tax=Salmonella enterica TaxID=28901 RepID=UPI003D2A860E
AHGGRPHWAKKHTLDAHALAPLYPRWQRFAAVRDAMDPDGAFLTPALRELLVSPP